MKIINQWPRGFRFAPALGLAVLAAGCAFDLAHVNQTPAALVPTGSASFVLLERVQAHLGTGYPTVLNANTTWNEAGSLDRGRVFATRDQIVKVEASNVYEAWIVVSNEVLTGFYLPVEKTFTPVSSPCPLKIKSNNP